MTAITPDLMRALGSPNLCRGAEVTTPPSITAAVVPLTGRIRLTKWTAAAPVTKRLSLGKDGRLEKTSTADQLTSGVVSRLECTPLEFIDVLSGVGPNDCLSFGVPRDHQATRVVTLARYRAAGDQTDLMTRTLDQMQWHKGPAIMMIDYDPPETGSLDRDGLLEALEASCPSIGDTTRIWVPSTSSCIYDQGTNNEVRGVRGQRVYVVVADGTDIPRAGKVLARRAWLNGYGYIRVSKAGSLLVRSPVDEAVFQPNRIDYCAPPLCEPPLVSRKPPPELIGDATLALNTPVAIPDLTPEEEERYDRLVATEKQRLKPFAEAARVEYLEQRIAEYSVRGIDRDTAQKMLMAALEQSVLHADFVLLCADGKTVTVGEVLADSVRWDGKRFADPVEPDYHGDLRIARAWLSGGGRPHLYSFAHGGLRYDLARQQATVRLVKGERADTVDKVIACLNELGTYYRRGRTLVTVDNDSQIAPVNVHQLQASLDRTIRFERHANKKWIAEDCPLELARQIVEAQVNRFRPLRAVLTAPSINPNTGELLEQPGYDPATQSLLIAKQPFPTIPDSPDLESVRSALQALWCPVHLFPFASPDDETAALTALLTAAVRPLLPTAPGFGASAPNQASGKTLLARVICELSGASPAVSPQPDSGNDEEMRKRLFAALSSGSRALIIDNIIGAFDSPSLAAMMTSEEYTDRVLRESRTDTVPSNVLVLLSGNNLTLEGDLPRRVLICRIDPQMELPHQREFPFDPCAIVREYRQELIAASLILFRGYITARGNDRHGLGRIASFEVWDDLVRQTICWLAQLQDAGQIPSGAQEPADTAYPRLRDPIHAINLAVREDPARIRLARLLVTWADTIGKGTDPRAALTIADILQKASSSHFRDGQDGDSLQELLAELAGNPTVMAINRKSLGKLLPGFKDRPIDGLCLREGPSRKKTKTWWVEDLAARE